MQFGLCAGELERIAPARDWGFDFVEISARVTLPRENVAAWKTRRDTLTAGQTPITHLGGFIPADLPMVGPEVDWARFRAYVVTVVERATELGVHTYNWGSAGARRVPDGWSYRLANEQIERAAHIIADALDRVGSTAAIEAINPRECNFIYYLPDALALERSVGRDSIRLNVDSYHMELQNEAWSNIGLVASELRHAHISGPDRRFPAPGDGFEHRAFLAALASAGYNRTIAFECGRVPDGTPYADAARAGVAFVREMWTDTVPEARHSGQ